ncbi:MAG: hypothetical protein JWP12_1048 [Bacteroidetes bacterium]|nr:hypothetical protein [Bacteroidota bacterium]
MKKQILYSFALLFAVLIASCSVDKRLYSRGYNVEWSNNNKVQLPSAEKITVIPEPTLAENKTEEISTDSLLQLSSDEDKAIADKAESNTACNDYAAKQRAEALAPVTNSATSTSKKTQRKIDFNSGFKKGFQLVIPEEPVKLMPLALASLILGILSVVAYYGAFVLGVLAIVFGAVALYKIRKNPGMYRGRGMAMWGFILGIISLAIITTILIFY